MNATSMQYTKTLSERSKRFTAERKQALSISPLLLGVLVVSQFLSQYLIWALLVSVIAFIALTNKGKIFFLSMPGFVFYATIFVIGIISGIFGVWNGTTSLWPYVRDVIYISLLPLYWALLTGADMFHYRNPSEFYRTIYLFCGIVCGYSCFEKMRGLFLLRMSLFELRHVAPVAEIIVAVGIVMFFIPARGIRAFKRTLPGVLSSVFIFLAFCLSFSRMTILYILSFLLFFGAKNKKTLLKVVLFAFILSTVAGIAAPEITGDFFDKIKNSMNEVVAKDRMWTSTEIVENWRGYEVYCTKETFKNYNAREQLFGAGFGSTIDTHGYAYLVTSEADVPFLHNGYYTMLFKCGLAGFICMFGLFIAMFAHAYKLPSSYDRTILLGLIVCMAVGSVFVSGVLWRVVNPITMVLYCDIWRRMADNYGAKEID